MKYSQSTQIAIESLFFMAAHPEKTDFAVDEVAEAQHVSASYLAKLFQQLVKSGLLRSHRGAKGGYALGRPLREITLLDIALVFEGSSPMYDCNAVTKNCNLSTHCVIVKTFREAEEKMNEVLRSVNLETVMQQMKGRAHEAEWLKVPREEKVVVSS